MSEMDDLLERLRSEGQVVDPGWFTLDPTRAARLLRKFRLTDPSLYGLLVVQAAVRLGATRVSLTESRNRDLFELEGVELPARVLEVLPGHAVTRGGEQSLALAILSAGELSPTRITVESGQKRLIVLSKGHRVEPGPTVTGIRLEVQLARGWFSGPRPARPSEALVARASRCPIPVEINGKPAARPGRRRDGAMAWCFLQGPVAVDWEPAGSRLEVRLTPGTPVTAILGVLPAGRPQGDLTVVVDGLTFPVESPRLPGFLTAVAWSREVAADASLQGVAGGPALDRLVACLADFGADLVLRLAELGPEGDPAAYLDILEECAVWRRPVLPGTWTSVLQRVLELRKARPDQKPHLGRSLARVGEAEWAAGEVVAAEAHLMEALPYLREFGPGSMLLPALATLARVLRHRGADDNEMEPVLVDLVKLMDNRRGNQVDSGLPPGRQADLELAEFVRQLAEIAERRRQWNRAEQHYWHLLRLLEGALGSGHPDLNRVLNRLIVLLDAVRPLEAQNLRYRAMEIWTNNPGRAEYPPDKGL
ncbi:MAG: hypothetical protein AB1758_07535 [Candidatus Eremiobacterota bacterium]